MSLSPYLGIKKAEDDHDDQTLWRVDDNAGVGDPGGDLVETFKGSDDWENELNSEDRRHREDRLLSGVKMFGRQFIIEHSGYIDEQ